MQSVGVVAMGPKAKWDPLFGWDPLGKFMPGVLLESNPVWRAAYVIFEKVSEGVSACVVRLLESRWLRFHEGVWP
jgi:hypothetical protein